MTQQVHAMSAFSATKNNENPFAIMRAMQQTMSENVAIFRHADRLQLAVDELQQLRERSLRIRVTSAAKGANPELVAAYRVQKMLKLCLCVASGALQRKESRGAHFREDFPLRNDRDWLCRTLAYWPNNNDDLPTLEYEALNVKKMELPPGWRGYGPKDRVEHPLTGERQTEVENIKRDIKAKSGDRFQLQAALMPYTELLPKTLRGRNQRIHKEEPL